MCFLRSLKKDPQQVETRVPDGKGQERVQNVRPRLGEGTFGARMLRIFANYPFSWKICWRLLKAQKPKKTRAFLGSGPGKPNQRKASSWTFPGGIPEQKVQCESCLFSQGKTPEFTKMGEIHELFVLALSLVWFAGATPDFRRKPKIDTAKPQETKIKIRIRSLRSVPSSAALRLARAQTVYGHPVQTQSAPVHSRIFLNLPCSTSVPAQRNQGAYYFCHLLWPLSDILPEHPWLLPMELQK